MKRLFLSIVPLFIFGILFANRANFPVTHIEAVESVNTYSLITRRTLFADVKSFITTSNIFVSPLSILIRIPFVALNNLTLETIRTPNMLVSLVFIFILVYWLNRNKFDMTAVKLAPLLILLMPLFIVTAMFHLGALLCLCFLLLALSQPQINFKTLLLFCGAIISSLYSLPFVIVYLISQYKQKQTKGFLVGLVLMILLVLLGYPRISNLLINDSIIRSILPSSFTYNIDKNLSFGTYIENPFYTKDSNYFRIAHNKPHYMVRESSRYIASQLNYELFTSPFQSATVIAREKSSLLLPKFYFWEIPVLIFGIFLLLNRSKSHLKPMIIAFSFSYLFFGIIIIWLAIPIVVAAHLSFVQYLYRSRRTVYLFSLGVYSTLVILSSMTFYDLFLNHQKIWFSSNEKAYQSVFTSDYFNINNLKKVVLTDRMGEPAYFYAFYKGSTNDLITADINYKVVRIGNAEFRSFQFSEEVREANEIWIGAPGEFVGIKDSYDKVTLRGGDVVSKVKQVNFKDTLIGDEIWIVKTH